MLLRQGFFYEEPFNCLFQILLQVLPASPFLEETRGLMGKSDYELFKVCNFLALSTQEIDWATVDTWPDAGPLSMGDCWWLDANSRASL